MAIRFKTQLTSGSNNQIIMKILEFKSSDYNQMDNIYLTVEEDQMHDQIVFESKKEDLNGYFFVKIYKSGLASFGRMLYKDPMHNNEPYIWSSNAGAINDIFELNGTPLQLARYDIGVRGAIGGYGAWHCTLTKLTEILTDHSDKLHYPLEYTIKRYTQGYCQL